MTSESGRLNQTVPLRQGGRSWHASSSLARHGRSYDSALTPTSSRAAEKALNLAGIRPGVRLLDIAAGGGALSVPAARLGADVLAIDYSRAMVNLLNEKAQRLGLANLTARYVDGTALDFEDDTFDFACSQLGIMLFPDRAKGLSEMTRVVKPGGKGVIVSLGAPERVQLLTVFFEALSRAVAGFETPRNSPLFSLKDPAVLRNEMEEAGLRLVEITSIEIVVEVESADQLWRMITAGAPAIAGLLRSVPEDRQAAAKSELANILAARGAADGTANLPMAFNIGVGIKGAA